MRSGKQPLDELVSNLQVSFLFHNAAGYIGITGNMRLVGRETGGGKALQVGFHHLGVHIHQAKASEEYPPSFLSLRPAMEKSGWVKSMKE